jgi:protein-S-isoprenylcysteine O-methyltransferase Ste14
MARRSFKDWWTTIVSPTVERSTYVLAASLVIAHLVWQWRPIPDVVWSVQSETARVVLIAVAVAGWIVLFVSTFLIDHFELFGLRQVIAHFRRRALDRPAFRTPGLYRLVRHPIYLGFMLGFWVTPRMTVGHLLFAIMATGYIFVGILFEERDLVVQFGDRYRRYRSEVGMLLPRLATLRAQPTTRRAER